MNVGCIVLRFFCLSVVLPMPMSQAEAGVSGAEPNGFLAEAGQVTMSMDRPVDVRQGSEGSIYTFMGDSNVLEHVVLQGSEDEYSGGRPLPVDEDGRASFLVRFSAPALSAYTGSVQGIPGTSRRVTGKHRLDIRAPASRAYMTWLEEQQLDRVELLGDYLQRSLTIERSLRIVVNAVVLRLTPVEAERVNSRPDVVNVERNKQHRIQTDFGPAWIQADEVWSGNSGPAGGSGTHGEGVVIGIIDTGINMQHPAFAATDTQGYTHENPLGDGNYAGWCNPAHPDHDPSLQCNSKLIGMWDFVGDGPIDLNGHGSHVAATAAGNFVDIDWDGFEFAYVARVSGVAPRSNLISYSVCSADGWCSDEHVVAAIEQAVVDGVDVINESIGIGGNTYQGIKQQAYLGALEAGVLTVRATGNSGPSTGSIGPEPPWVLSVGASTHDREVIDSSVQSNPALADRLAQFSSRGPSSGAVFKPDLAAPGVSILAAVHADDDETERYQLISGTSMASPHIAGAAALLRALYPDWTPMEVASALRGSANIDSIFNHDGTKAGVHDFGNGRLNLSAAANAVLLLDETPEVFEASDPAEEGDPRTLNLPALSDRQCDRVCSWERVFRNPTDQTLEWTASYHGTGQIEFLPASFSLGPGESVTVVIQADMRLSESVGSRIRGEGRARWTNSNATVPDLVMPVFVDGGTRSSDRFPADVAIHSDQRALNAGQEVTFTAEFSAYHTADYHLHIQLPPGLDYVAGSASNGLSYDAGHHSLSWDGPMTTIASLMPVVDNPVGYVPIRNFIPGGTTFVDWFIVGLVGLDYWYAGMRLDGIWPHGGAGVLYPLDPTMQALRQNSSLPGYARSPGLIAPFWTDIRFGWQQDGSVYPGRLYRARGVGAAGKRWYVWEWNDVTLADRPDLRFTFQFWLDDGGDDHRIVYGPGDWEQYSDYTVGFQDVRAQSGDMLFYNDTGSRPRSGDEYRIVYEPETITVEFTSYVDAPTLEPLVVDAELSSSAVEITDTAWTAVYVTEPTGLAFSQSPRLATADRAIQPGVQVEVVDSLGNRVDIDGVMVELELEGVADGLIGVVARSTESGLAVFPNIAVAVVGGAHRLVATAAGLDDGLSTPMSVVEMTNCANVTDIPEAECEALTDFALATGVSEWSDNSGWLDAGSTTACTRHGVTCVSGRVFALDFVLNNLSGELPQSLSALHQLDSLRLVNNSLSGSLPGFLAELPALRSLNLALNHFRGGLPAEWESMDQLISLNLNGTLIAGSLPGWIGNLTALRELRMSQTRLSGSIPPEIGNLHNLQSLWLRSNRLTGSIPPEIGQLKQLHTLALRGNPIEGELPVEMGQLQNLRTLFLYSTSLRGNLIEELAGLPALDRLHLSDNLMQGQLPANFAQISSARIVWLENIGLQGRLPEQIGGMTNLESLWLGGNSLHGFLPEDIGDLSELRWLGLGDIFSSEEIPEWRDLNHLFGEIPGSIVQLDKLQSLTLSGNCLRASGSTLDFVQQFDPGFPDNQFCQLMLAWIEPISGDVSGGDSIEMFGMEFSTETEVEIAGQPCAELEFHDENRLVCKIPPGSEGYADVLVRNPDGSEHLLARGFEYIDPNTVFKDRFQSDMP